MTLALSVEEATLWEISLGVGAVVIVVVIALLGLLLHLVGAIEAGAGQLLEVARAVGGNTSNIKSALTVADTLDEVAAEAGRHAALLGVGAS